MSLVANQITKAQRFADFLDEHLPADVADMRLWTDTEWQAVTDLFNANRDDGRVDTTPRSSRSTIVAILTERRSVVDPFAGVA